MITAGKGHYWGDFRISNQDISGTRRAIGTFESALESWSFILFDDVIFETLEYSAIDPQMKIGHMSIYEKSGKITKSRLDERIWRVNCDIFFWKRFMMILSEKNFDGTQNGTHNSNFGSEVIKSDFSNIENDEISKERRIWLKFI